MIRWAVVGAIPWAVYALAQARLQLANAPSDPHAGLEHWGMSFLMAAGIMICAMVGASDHDGWQLPAWTAALVSILFGVHSLVFPGLASGLPTPWASAAVVWGVVYAAALVRRSRRAVAEEGVRGGSAGLAATHT